MKSTNYQQGSKMRKVGSQYMQRARSLTVRGVKIGLKPTVLSAAVFAFFNYLLIVVADDEFSLDFYTIFFILVFIIVLVIFLLVGSAALGSVLALWKTKLSNMMSGFLGLAIGIIVTLIVNRYLFINIFYGADYEVIAYTHSLVDLITIFFPGVLEVLILTYVGWRINGAESSISVVATKE